MVRTELNVNGFNGVYTDGVLTPLAVSKSTSTTDAMPNLTLKALLTPDVIARFNAGKAIQRPAFADFNPGTTYNVGGGGTIDPTATGGNPDLKPIESTNVDLAAEWYFAPTGRVTAGCSGTTSRTT